MKNSIYTNGRDETAVGIAYRLHALCKVGAAASDTTLAIDLHCDGWNAMFEVMAGLCDDMIDVMEKAERLEGK